MQRIVQLTCEREIEREIERESERVRERDRECRKVQEPERERVSGRRGGAERQGREGEKHTGGWCTCARGAALQDAAAHLYERHNKASIKLPQRPVHPLKPLSHHIDPEGKSAVGEEVTELVVTRDGQDEHAGAALRKHGRLRAEEGGHKDVAVGLEADLEG